MKIHAVARVIDTEGTGLKPPPEDAICEIGWCDVFATSKDKDGTPRRWVVDPAGPKGILVNPGRPMPYEAQAVHHISDAELADAPTLAEAMATVLSPHSYPNFDGPTPCAFVAHYAKHDRQYLESFTGEAPWICTERCAKHQWPGLSTYKNHAVRYWLNVRDFDMAKAMPMHRAPGDAYTTAVIFRELMNVGKTGHTIERLVEGTKNPPLIVICPMGSDRGKPMEEVGSSFLRWMINNPDKCGEDLQFTARYWLKSRGELL